MTDKIETKPEEKNTDSEAAAKAGDGVEKRTVGEELYLVHLQRHQGEEPSIEDFDHEHLRKRSRSIGEELWEVHVKRSRGLEPDLDVEVSETEANKTKSKVGRRASPKDKKPQRCSERLAKVMHLRNRDVKKVIIQ